MKQVKTRTIILLLLAAFLSGCASSNLAKPTRQQLTWQDDEMGMFICFGLWTWPIGVTEDLDVLADTQKKFNPTDLDTDQWVSVAESMGAKYVLYTAKHADGFCMWQTDTTDFSIKHTPWRDGKGDILADLAESCRKRGMKLAIYHDARDVYFLRKVQLSGAPSANPIYNTSGNFCLTRSISRDSFSLNFSLPYSGVAAQ